MYTMAHYVGDDYVVIENPTSFELIDAIKALKERDQTQLSLYKASSEHLIVSRCKRLRYAVRYGRPDENGGYRQTALIDPDYADKETLVPYFDPDGMKEYSLLYQTITLDETIRVFIYFLEHGTLPQDIAI
jgi:hypothetical protein